MKAFMPRNYSETEVLWFLVLYTITQIFRKEGGYGSEDIRSLGMLEVFRGNYGYV